LHAPVPVPVDDVAPVAVAQQLRVVPRVVGPRARPGADADLLRLHYPWSGKLGCSGPANSRLGTMTRRRNTQTMVPSCLYPRVSTVTTPRSALDSDSRLSSTVVSPYTVSPWNVGATWRSDSTSRFAIALPDTSGTDMPSRIE